MGQYYKIIILADTKYKKEVIRAWLCPQTFGNGAKLMEHSYIDNNFVKILEYLISPIGMFYMSRIVWSGDYADNEESENENLYRITEEKENLELVTECPVSDFYYRYIINHTQKLYIDKEKCSKNSNSYVIHPLPLLISEGNGRGGGDYSGQNEHLCGSWSRDIISIDSTIPEEFTEIECDFCVK